MEIIVTILVILAIISVCLVILGMAGGDVELAGWWFMVFAIATLGIFMILLVYEPEPEKTQKEPVKQIQKDTTVIENDSVKVIVIKNFKKEQ